MFLDSLGRCWWWCVCGRGLHYADTPAVPPSYLSWLVINAGRCSVLWAAVDPTGGVLLRPTLAPPALMVFYKSPSRTGNEKTYYTGRKQGDTLMGSLPLCVKRRVFSQRVLPVMKKGSKTGKDIEKRLKKNGEVIVGYHYTT